MGCTGANALALSETAADELAPCPLFEKVAGAPPPLRASLSLSEQIPPGLYTVTHGRVRPPAHLVTEAPGTTFAGPIH